MALWVHAFNYLKRSKLCLKAEHFNHLKSYFTVHDGFFFNPENVMICGFLSPMSPPEIKARALEMILRARAYELQKPPNYVRIFQNPLPSQLDYNSQNFFDVLLWDQLPNDYITPPPILRNFSNGDLKSSLIIDKIPRFLCHSQGNEFHVANTTKAVSKKIGKEQQKSNIISTIQSRKNYNCKKFKKCDDL